MEHVSTAIDLTRHNLPAAMKHAAFRALTAVAGSIPGRPVDGPAHTALRRIAAEIRSPGGRFAAANCPMPSLRQPGWGPGSQSRIHFGFKAPSAPQPRRSPACNSRNYVLMYIYTKEQSRM